MRLLAHMLLPEPYHRIVASSYIRIVGSPVTIATPAGRHGKPCLTRPIYVGVGSASPDEARTGAKAQSNPPVRQLAPLNDGWSGLTAKRPAAGVGSKTTGGRGWQQKDWWSGLAASGTGAAGAPVVRGLDPLHGAKAAHEVDVADVVHSVVRKISPGRRPAARRSDGGQRRRSERPHGN